MKMNVIVMQVAFLTFFLIACQQSQKKQRQANQAIPVNTAIVQQKQLVYYDNYPSTLVALKEVELRAEVGGDITGIFFKDGQEVKKGQELYEIDRREYEASYDQAKANLNIAEQNLEKTQRDANRYIALNKEDAIAKQQLDNALTDLQNAKSQVSSAQAALEKAKTNLNYSVISAPFNGTIGISQVRMGALVTPSTTLLNVISSDDPMGADIQIQQGELERFLNLQNKNPAPNDSTCRILLADNSVYKHFGRVIIIDRNVDPQTGTIRVRLSFPNSERYLRPGMKCDVQVLNTNSGLQMVIPYKAVMEQMSEYFVYKVDSGKAKEVKISMGPKIGPDVIVRQGLKPGDQIVTDGLQRLHEGVSVTTTPEGAPPAGGLQPQGKKPEGQQSFQK